MNSRYLAARFASSAEVPERCPPAIAEVAFAGRSNAGKSSALNALTGQRRLARTSRTPGRTQLINHFALDAGRYLVDLPGYGYAAVSKARKAAWQASLARYVTTRDALRGIVVVMDIRHPLNDTDRVLIDLQQQSGADLHVLLTKGDKIGRGERIRTLHRVRDALERDGIEASLQDFSATARFGLDDLAGVLDHWLYDAPFQTGDEADDEADDKADHEAPGEAGGGADDDASDTRSNEASSDSPPMR